jgi:ferredoxin
MRVVVNLTRCQGYAQCAFLAPDVFRMRGNEAPTAGDAGCLNRNRRRSAHDRRDLEDRTSAQLAENCLAPGVGRGRGEGDHVVAAAVGHVRPGSAPTREPLCGRRWRGGHGMD